MAKEKLDDIARGFRARTLVTAKLGAKLGLAAAKKQLGLSSSNDDDVKQAAMSQASELVRELGALKGFVMKVGQMASYLPGALPPDAQRVLTALQAESTALEWPRIEQALRAELGGSPDDLFESFDPEPLAAASIGQVHRARHQGRDVAVKIQYPGIDELLEKDLDMVRTMARVAFVGVPIDAAELVDELRARMREECDYRIEADNQRFFRELLSVDPECHVPDVIAERTARKVITTELVTAQSFYPFTENATEAQRNAAGKTIFRTSFGSIFKHRVYNADPHPGNYLFHDDGRVTFLDFGCIRRFDRDFIVRWKALALCFINGDRKNFPERLNAAGFVGNPAKFDYDAHWDLVKYLYRPFTEKDFRYSQEYVRQSYDILIFKNKNRMAQGMSPEWLFLNRLQWGLNSVLALLHAQGSFVEMWREMVESPTP